MVSNLSGPAALFLADVGRIQNRIAKASREISSGKKIGAPSDAPDEIEPLLQLRADRERNGQIRSNLTLAKTEADGADAALTSAIKLMDRARTLAAQGATTTLDAAGRRSLAGEIEALQDQMVACSRTTVQGRFIFSGDQDGSPAYETDLTADAGAAPLAAAAAPATRRVEHPAGGSFAASITAREIFDKRNQDGTPAADNVFAALNNIRLALLSGDAGPVTAAAPGLQVAAAQLNTAQAFYGTVQGRIQQAQSYAESYDVQLQTQLSQKEDADAPAAALELTQGNTQLQAAFQMRARLPNQSLFDYLG